jgi:hypothetical protein
LNNRLQRAATSLGICLVTTGLVIWIRGGFDSTPRRTDQFHQLWMPPPGQSAMPTTASTRVDAIQLMMMGKTGAFSLPGVVQPHAQPAKSAMLGDDAQIVGIEINGTCRAYSLAQMRMPWTHVINDLVGGVPVTVTYCDRTDCLRVFTADAESPEPLNVGVGGFVDGKMLLHVEQRNFIQDSHEIPLADLEFERTTWKPWKIAHPETDVCTDLTPGGRMPRPEAGNGDGSQMQPLANPSPEPSLSP